MELNKSNYVYIDISIEKNFRKYKEGDHIIHLYGIDENILGAWISKKNVDEEPTFLSDEFQSVIPAGFKINGIILIYNENVYEDFDSIISKEIQSLRNVNTSIVSDNIFAFVMKDVLYLDDFDSISFEKSISFSIDSTETEVDAVVTDLSATLKKNYYFMYSQISIEYSHSSTSDNSIIQIELNKNIEESINKSILSNLDFESFYLYLESSKTLIDNINSLNNTKIDHITSLLEKLNLKEEELTNFTLGVKSKSGSKNIKKIQIISTDNTLPNNYTLDIGGYVNKKNCDFLKLANSFLANLKFLLFQNNNQPFRNLTINKIFIPHPFFYVPNCDEILLSKMILPSTKFIPASLYNSTKFQPSRLLNVHKAIKKEIGVYSKQSVVKGDYEYYHYCQDGVNDKGWGCAYRSLQTLFSWFLMNGFYKAGLKVPTILDIQTTLVKVGDKESKLIGSSDWIGAFEVSIVLNELLGIESQINYISTGAELASRGRELIYHFETQGTPIMIGGGVYAYTILGVEYDRVKGDCMFLILDPHYPGDEDIKTIVNKGWCEWKTASLFEKGNFYNMCMPQIPK